MVIHINFIIFYKMGIHFYFLMYGSYVHSYYACNYNITLYSAYPYITYVTEFSKTDHVHTRNEIQFCHYMKITFMYYPETPTSYFTIDS